MAKNQSWLDQLLSTASNAATASGIPVVSQIPAAVRYAFSATQADLKKNPVKPKTPVTVSEVLKRSARVSKQVVGQVPAGLISTTVANSARKNETGANARGYRPAIVDAIPAFAGTIGALSGHAPDKGSFLSNSMERMGLADERTNEALGIDAPQDALQTGLNVAGSLIVPGADLTALNKLGTVGKVAKVATELAVPLRQGSMASALKTVVPVGVGLREGIEAIAPSDTYRGVSESSVDQNKAQIPVASEQQLEAVPQPQDDMLANMGEVAAPAVSDEDEMLKAFGDQHDEQKQSGWLTAAEVLGVGILGTGSYKVARALIDKAPSMGFESVIGQTKIKSNLKRGQNVNTEVFDSTLPIMTNANTFLDPAYAKKLNYKLDTISNQATGAQVRNFLTSGVAPLASKRYTPVASVLEPLAQELKPAQQTMLGDALLFASTLDDIKASGVQASFNDVKPADMQKLVDFVKNDPVMGKHFTRVQQSFADHLAYEVDIGKRSAGDAAKFRNDNPNYVPFKRDVVSETDGGMKLYNPRTDANQSIQSDLMRNISEERGGVQQGAVRNPIDLLSDMWRDSIVQAKQNDLRANYLERLASNPNAKTVDSAKSLVKRLPDGELPKSWEKVHTVYENGKVVHYQVNDPALDRALQFQSRAGFKFLDSWRQTYQSMTTGPLGSLASGFQFFVGPVYDTAIGMLFKDKGVHLGNINEMLSKVSPNASIGRLDPTQILGAYTGAVRYMFDDLTLQASSNLTNQLMRDNSFLRQAIGDNAVTALRDRFDAAYQSSVKALGEETGVFSHMMRGSPDSTTAIAGLEDVAPKFSTASGERVAQQAVADNSWYQGVLAASKVPFIATRSSAIGRTFQLVSDAAHNGFRYSALAANRSRMADMDELASKMRRISIDSSQHGANDTINAVAGSTIYSNITLQTMYDLGRRIAADPTNVGINFATVLGGYAALRYMALADPEVQARDKDKTTAQKNRTVSLPGGAELPVEPIMRIPWALTSTFFDHVSGHDNGEYNPAFMSAIGSWFEQDNDKIGDERFGQDINDAIKSALYDNAPWTPEQMPVVATSQALAGVNPSMSKVTGETSLVHGQSYSGFDTDKKFVGGLTSAYFENLINTAVGSFASHALETADEVYRGAGHYKGPIDAVRAAGDIWKDNMVGGAKLFRPMLFGQYESVKSVGDTNFNLLKGRQEGIKNVLGIYSKDVMAEALQGSSLDPRYSDILEDGSYELQPQYMGTPLQTVGMMTKMLERQTRTQTMELSALTNEKQRVQANTQAPIESRNRQVNEINEKRRALTYQVLMATRQMEEQIGSAIGDEHFTYDGLDPQKYMQPALPQDTSVQPAP